MPRSPLRTGRADLPHPALQSVVCSITETGIRRFPGIQQAKEPEFREVAVGPTLVVFATAPTFQAAPLSQNGPQSCPHWPMKGERTRSPSSGGWRVSRQAVCGASRPADIGRMSTVNSEWRRRQRLFIFPLAIRHSPLATRRITRTRPLTSTSRPPWASPCSCSRLPPAGADATAQGGRITAGRTGGTVDDDDAKQRSDCFSDTGFVVCLIVVFTRSPDPACRVGLP